MTTGPATPSHDTIADLLGAYALDAVEPDEAALIVRHLDVCPRCRDELRSHREVAGLLGAMGGTAPLGLWDQIAANAHEPPPALQLARSHPTRGRRHRGVPLRAVVAATAVAAAVVAVLGVEVGRLDHQRDPNQIVSAMAATPTPTMATVRMALDTPGSREVALLSLTTSRTLARAVVLPSGDGYLYDTKLDPIAADRTYQLWGVVGDQRISYGLLGTDLTSVIPFRAGSGLQGLAVTNEVAGGVETSTQPLVLVGAAHAVPVVPVIGKTT